MAGLITLDGCTFLSTDVTGDVVERVVGLAL
jgi:hypothetical protein